MKRNMDLIRDILLQREADKSPMELPECSGQEEFAYHVALLKEAGLVEAVIRPDHYGMPAAAQVLRLTWAGHEFLDAARNNTVWHTAKEKIAKSGASWTVSLLKDLLIEIAKKQLLGGP